MEEENLEIFGAFDPESQKFKLIWVLKFQDKIFRSQKTS